MAVAAGGAAQRAAARGLGEAAAAARARGRDWTQGTRRARRARGTGATQTRVSATWPAKLGPTASVWACRRQTRHRAAVATRARHRRRRRQHGRQQSSGRAMRPRPGSERRDRTGSTRVSARQRQTSNTGGGFPRRRGRHKPQATAPAASTKAADGPTAPSARRHDGSRRSLHGRSTARHGQRHGRR